MPTVAALFDVAKAFANQPLPRGNRVAIVTNAGGPGIIAADAAETYGLDVHELSASTQDSLRSLLPEEASVRNPVDMVAGANATSYEAALGCVLDDDGVDAAIAAFVPPLGIQAQDVAAAIDRADAQRPDKPVLAVLMGGSSRAAVPTYLFPESAARSLAAMWHQRSTALRAEGRLVEYECDDDAIETMLDAALAAGQTRLSEPDALRLMKLAGIPILPWRYAYAGAGAGAGEHADLATAAADAAETLSFPVAIKICSPQIMHKSDVGGVTLGLASRESVVAAVTTMLGNVDEVLAGDGQVDGILVQQMAGDGTETIVGMTRTPRVGPLVMFGLGGIFVEVLRDVVLRLAPLLDTDAAEMVRKVKLRRLLEGVRGQPPRDLAALEEVILRVSQLACRHPRLAEMDINPLLARPDGVLAVDARVTLSAEAVE